LCGVFTAHFMKTSSNKIDINDSVPLGPQGAHGSAGILAYRAYGKKIGGVVKAGDILNIGEYVKYQSIAHEFYHAYQNDNGIHQRTFSLEIEADLFGTAISSKINIVIYAFFGDITNNKRKVAGQTYQTVMHNMLIYGYNKKDYETAIKNFAQGSNMNFNNTYVNAGYIQDTLPITQKPLISKFILLV